ncbi:hypothetical protein [Fodinicola feengrottensis]|uniref:hypothetical protein n=1 Tax=Fodinicola feengrottensis TaxID=435914 RepID=UPI0013D51152|nr:hypothetical protein [Fodinicola feengrottensis]
MSHLANLPTYAYAILGVLLIAVVIARQIGERRMSLGKLVVMPILFAILPFFIDKGIGHNWSPHRWPSRCCSPASWSARWPASPVA